MVIGVLKCYRQTKFIAVSWDMGEPHVHPFALQVAIKKQQTPYFPVCGYQIRDIFFCDMFTCDRV